jgi:hypothetical protein
LTGADRTCLLQAIASVPIGGADRSVDRNRGHSGNTQLEAVLKRDEIRRVEKYLRTLFHLDTITLVERPKQQDSVEVHIDGEFIGVIFKDEEDGEVSYAFNMAILEMDLPQLRADKAK